MTEEVDPKLIAKGLRFLASGFEMAADSGVPGQLVRTDQGSSSPIAGGLPKQVRVSCNVDMLEIDRFRLRLPADFLLRAIGEGTTSETVIDPEGAAIGVMDGFAARDGSESYRIARLDLAFADLPGGFAMTADWRLGQPIAHSFIVSSPIDRSDETYRASFEVRFEEMFKFLFPVTKRQADALIARISEVRGVTLERPPFYVTERER